MNEDNFFCHLEMIGVEVQSKTYPIFISKPMPLKTTIDILIIISLHNKNSTFKSWIVSGRL
jgi:hypothetical protein